MSSITQNLLSQYYGFGRKLDPKKSISSHEVIDSLEVLHKNDVTDRPTEDVKNGEITEEKEIEEKNEEILDARTPSGDGPLRSLRVLEEDNLLEENINVNDYEKFLDSKSICNDYTFKVNEHLVDSKNQSIGDKVTSIDNKSLGRACEETSVDPNFLLVKDISLDNTSDVSTSEVKKKSSEKFKTSITPLSSAPKKTPSCNGVYLDLAYSEINVFPISMLQEIAGLRMLYLENNKLTELPDVLFSSLRQLQWLDVRHNLLTMLTANVKGHPCLETILLQGNKIEKLPLELCLVPNLKRLQTIGNPLTFPPENIVASGFTGLLNFLRNKWNESHPEEIVQSTKDYDEIEPKPSTVLCYQLKGSKSRRPVKSLSLEKASRTIDSATTVTRTKTRSVREKSFNYRPSNRYHGNNTTKAQKQQQRTTIETTQNSLCESCALVLRDAGSFSIRNNVERKLELTKKRLLEHVDRPRISLENDDNANNDFSHSLALPPKFGQIAANGRTRVSYKLRETRSCKLKLPIIDPPTDFNSDTIREVKSRKMFETGERTFRIVVNDGTTMKLCPMRLNDPRWMLAFLEIYLDSRKRTGSYN